MSPDDALRRLMESADQYESEAKIVGAWDEGGSTETIVRGIQQYREAATPSPAIPEAGLDRAWAEAEAALPEGLALRLHGSVVRRGEVYYAEAIRDLTAAKEGHGWEAVEDSVGDTPQAALEALTERLRAEPAE